MDWLSCHVDVAAFEVEDAAAAMEARLVFFGIEYTKVYVPDTDAQQLFFFDPGADSAICCFNVKYPLHVSIVCAAGLTLIKFQVSLMRSAERQDLLCLRKLCRCSHPLSSMSVQMTPKCRTHLCMLVAETVMVHAEGHGVEVGCDYDKVADMLRKKLGNNGAAVAP